MSPDGCCRQEAETTIGALTDLAAMRRLGVANGLEDAGRGDDGIVAAWGASSAGRLVGAVCLERRGSLQTVNWLAVEEECRRCGIATALCAEVEQEARRGGARQLWVTARAPRFFVAQGFERVAHGPERETLLGGCLSCPQYGRQCRPEVLVKTLETGGS